jgi:hypothetical protein
MRTHTNQLGDLLDVVREGALMEVAPVEQPPVGKVFQWLKMSCVRLIVADVELVIVHKASSQTSRKKRQQAGGTLFGMVIKPYLAGFQNIISDQTTQDATP